ncbi:M9 family metallopeptidase [Kitasatospora sp. GP82]|uniref:M9 family metallopeptidase n=1 Tax=Kitasatospora sp. GP82 TaxID=3035089 RepID=UPI002475ACF9|nr:M9 family metallopeptidase [Kitasatospora sp. GP82]MDH6125663.1 microbial collagenase [Kitasatospora sp. GP82]
MSTASIRRDLLRLLIAALACCLGISLFAPASQARALTGPAVGVPRPTTPSGLPPQSVTKPATPDAAAEESHSGARPVDAAHRAPLKVTADPAWHSSPATAPHADAACSVSDFTSRSGSALVQQVESATVDCVNSLFSVTGDDAYQAFREPQMVSVADALRDVSANYAGDDSTSAEQLVLYLRAGYYVQWNNASTVGSYGTALQTAVRGALDAFYANSRSSDVNDANGAVLAEAVTLIDSAQENARYLYVVKRLLSGYDSSTYNSSYWMLTAVNNTYTVLFRGHQLPEFTAAVQADPSLLDTLRDFAVANDALLGTAQSYLTANAGHELGRFLQHAELIDRTRPLVKDLLGRSAMTGRTAPLWTGLADTTQNYDQANCAYYGTCDLAARLRAAVLTTDYTCSPSIRIVAQQMSPTDLDATCTSLRGEDAYVHGIVRDNGPVADDHNSTIEVVVFHSSADYQTYAGLIFGISTDNGGMYIEGDPAAAGNQPRFVAYEAEWVRPVFQIWNLNHEYTHYLDGRFDMYGDFNAGTSTPTVWWIEGFAEYVSYSYRNVDYTDAIAQAAKGTYKLSTLFDTTYDNDRTRIYNWGYLAVRYMLQSHRADVDTLLGYYRVGDWAAARTLLTSTIGTRYDSDWSAWLSACAAGNCGATTAPPVAECTATDTRELGQDCGRSNLAANTGNYSYLYLRVPAGTSRLTITSSGGTGDADLYYSADGWATMSNWTARSTQSGNGETLTISNPPAGIVYISLYAKSGFASVNLSTAF